MTTTLDRPAQARDDLALLDVLLADLEAADPLYRPTPYWAAYFDETVRFLREEGLADFRRKSDGHLPSFGACELRMTATPRANLRGANVPPDHLEKMEFAYDVFETNPAAPILPFGLSADDLHMSAYRITELQGAMCGARPIASVEASPVGSPAVSFRIDGRFYTHSFFNYYWRYAYCCQHLDFEHVDNVIEIGSGAGKQVEVLKKLHPHLNFYLLDLAPQLYVAHQYLDAVFPGDVVDYRELRGTHAVTAEGKGQILPLSNADVTRLAPRGRSLLWNAASFAEMEPDVVAHYLAHGKPHVDGVYMFQCMQGRRRRGDGPWGVDEPVTFEHYERALAPDFELLDRWPAFVPLKKVDQAGGYEDALWLSRAGRRLLRDK